MNNKVEDSFDLEIESLAFGGMGLGRLEGQIVFVPYTVPGDYIRAGIIKKEADYIIGSLEDILKSSPMRQEPRCEYFGECGGCQWQHVDYKEQVIQKKALLQEAFTRISHFDFDAISPCIPSPSQFYYRHRMQFNINHRDKRPHIGLYKRKTHNLVDIYECSIAHPLINKALRAVWEWAEITNDKHLQGVDITCDIGGEKAILVLRYMKGSVETKKRDFLLLQNICPEIIGALIRIEEYRKACSDIAGEPNLELIYNDYRYLIGPETFIQVNLSGNELLIKKVLEGIQPRIGRVLELHCGMGNFSIPMSRLAQMVIGVESSPEAYRYAQINAHYNKRPNCNFMKKSDIKALKQLIRSGMEFSVLVLDPPRSGSKDILDLISNLRIQKIIYISCNPSTLARDLSILAKEQNYKIDFVQPIDMFPQTYHVESVCVLSIDKGAS